MKQLMQTSARDADDAGDADSDGVATRMKALAMLPMMMGRMVWTMRMVLMVMMMVW